MIRKDKRWKALADAVVHVTGVGQYGLIELGDLLTFCHSNGLNQAGKIQDAYRNSQSGDDGNQNTPP